MKQLPIGFSTALAGLAALALSFSFPSVVSAQAQTPSAGNAAANPAGNQAGKLAMCMGCHGIENYRTAYPEPPVGLAVATAIYDLAQESPEVKGYAVLHIDPERVLFPMIQT